MLSSFASPFSKHGYALGDRQQTPRASKHPADAKPSDPHYIPLPLFTPNLHQIHSANSNSYWCGRFQAICDRFNDETLAANVENLQQYDADSSSSGSSTPTADAEEEGYKPKSTLAGEESWYNFSKKKPKRPHIDAQDERRARAFLHLQSLCTTNQARRSLWEFQLEFARIKGKPHLLPRGGKMVDDRSNWFGRVGKAMVGSHSSGYPPRASLGARSRKSSVASFLNR